MPEPPPGAPRSLPPATSGTAGFVGRFTRGPFDVAVAVDGRQQLEAIFGPALADGDTTVAVEQFFRNGGARARVVRVPDTDGRVEPAALLGSATQRTGLHALASADADLVAVPDAARHDPDVVARFYAAAADVCAAQEAFLLVDPPEGLDDLTALRTWATRDELASPHAALYAPWIDVEDPLTGRPRRVAPSGTVAGVLARTDVARGVWVAAAGREAQLRDIAGLAVGYGERDQALLGRAGVNLLRHFPSIGEVVWGSRTLAADGDAEWRYVPVGRTVAMLRRTLHRGLGWVAGRDNDEVLWTQVRAATERTLRELWRRGAFPADREEHAYVVRCGLGSTVTEADVAAGVLHLEVGVALVRPAEFTWIRVTCSTLGVEEHGFHGARRPTDVARLPSPAGARLRAADVPVVRVDLGRVVSRYIGETEENLRRLFDRLEGTEVLLTFDEADALFGRRGDPPPDPPPEP